MGYLQEIMLWGAVLTMVTGVLGAAAAQYEFRRILSFHIVSQIGYMILGLALYTPLAIAGGVFAIMHNIIVKTNLFLISGITHRLQGTYQLKKMGGLYKERPWLAVAFFISAFSLAGAATRISFHMLGHRLSQHYCHRRCRSYLLILSAQLQQ